MRCTKKLQIGLAFFLPLAAVPDGGGASFTATNWLAAMSVEGIWATNGSGEVCLKGNVCVYRVLSADSRAAGRLQVAIEWAYGSDGRAILAGHAYSELGTWDSAGTEFTRTGGLWSLTCRGVAEADGSSEVHLTGYGIGEAIDDWQIDIAASRGAGDRFDQTIPQIASGTINPPPIAAEVIDDFNDNQLIGWNERNSRNGEGQLFETNEQFTVRGYWPGVQSTVVRNCWAKGWRYITGRTVADGQTVEHRVDLVRMGENTSQVCCGVTGYILVFGRTYIGIIKWLPKPSLLAAWSVNLPETNIVLSVAKTRVHTNLLLTAQVFQKGGASTGLFVGSVWDTPAVDPTLSSNQLYALTGVVCDTYPDEPGLPRFYFDYLDLEVQQFNDGSKPEAIAVFDNLELHTYAVPLLSIAPAVQLTWPATGMNFEVEGAPTLTGPWVPVKDFIPPGFQQLAVPRSEPTWFWRLRQAP